MRAQSILNKRITPLPASGEYIGEWEFNDSNEIMVTCKSDAAGKLFVDFSDDKGTTVSTLPSTGFTVRANIYEFHTIIKGPRWFRVRYINGAIAQTTFSLRSYSGAFRQGNVPFINAIPFDADSVVVRSNSELEVMTGQVEGEYIVPKFGVNSDIDGVEDINDTGGIYTGFPTTAAEEFQVITPNAADDTNGTGARVIRIYYLNDDYEMFDANGDFLFIDVNTAGASTGASLSGVTGMRVWGAEVVLSGSGNKNAGAITVRWVTTTTVIFTIIAAGASYSEITAFTVPSGYTGYIKRYSASMDDTLATRIQMAIKSRKFGTNTERFLRPFVITNSSSVNRSLFGGQKIEEKEDFTFTVISTNGTNSVVTVSYEIFLQRNNE